MLKGEDKDAIEAAATKLTEATGSVAQKMYAEQASAAEGAQGDAGGAEASGDNTGDEAVDAEFEEVDDNKK